MEKIPALLSFCENTPLTGDFPSQKQETRSFYILFDLAWTNVWINTRDANDLRHRTHYDVTVMISYFESL